MTNRFISIALGAVLALGISNVVIAVDNGTTNGFDSELNGWNGLDNPDGVTGSYSIDNNWQDFYLSEWLEPKHDWLKERFMLFHQNRIDLFWTDRNDRGLDTEVRIGSANPDQDYYDRIANASGGFNTNMPFTKAPEDEDPIQERFQGYSETDMEMKDIVKFKAEFNYFWDTQWNSQKSSIAGHPVFNTEIEYCNKFFIDCRFDGTGRFFKKVNQQ